MYTVRLLATDQYYPAPSGVISLAELPSQGWVDVQVYALDIEYVTEREAVRYGSRQVRISQAWWGIRMHLQSRLYRFPDDEPGRRQLEETLVSGKYLWLQFLNYPAPLCSSDQAIAVELESLEIEHSHTLGGKCVNATLYMTER